MTAFLDTSVLIAAFLADHDNHEPSLDVFLRFGRSQACCAAHSLAEVYGTVTGMPPPHRVGSRDALMFLEDVRSNLTPIALTESEYFEALKAAAGSGIVGGVIYDMLLARCALQAGAKAIYTWNQKDFVRLGGDIASRVRTPAEAG